MKYRLPVTKKFHPTYDRDELHWDNESYLKLKWSFHVWL